VLNDLDVNHQRRHRRIDLLIDPRLATLIQVVDASK
jgi:hypothetical protein